MNNKKFTKTTDDKTVTGTVVTKKIASPIWDFLLVREDQFLRNMTEYCRYCSKNIPHTHTNSLLRLRVNKHHITFDTKY